MCSPIKVNLLVDKVGTTKGDSVMRRPPNIFILVAGFLFLATMSLAFEELLIEPSNILGKNQSIPEYPSKQIKVCKT